MLVSVKLFRMLSILGRCYRAAAQGLRSDLSDGTEPDAENQGIDPTQEEER